MSGYKKIPTSAEVCAVIRARHNHDMRVFLSFSDPDGSLNGGEVGRMDTAYGLEGCDWPLIEYRTTWDIDQDSERSYKRHNEKHEYWLCIPLRDEE